MRYHRSRQREEMPPVDGKARFRRRQRAQRLDSELNDLGVRWWHIVFALPAAAISVFIGRWFAINVQRMKWGTIKGELVSWGVNLFERAPGPVVNNDLLIEEKLWMRDDFFEAKLGEGSKCPFERVSGLNEFEEYDDKIDIPDEMMSKPFIIEGLMESWPAMQNDRWQRYKLLKSYGKKSVASKTQTGIIYGGGKTNMKFTSFSRVLKDMRQSSGGIDDSFVFDSSILNSIPELKEDIEEHEAFVSWAKDDAGVAQSGNTWHIFSLGASRTGLPFHSHGPTWLGLVHGLKKWYIYPPGTGPPADYFNQTGIVSSVGAWVSDILPSMLDLPVAPMLDLEGATGAVNQQGYRPIEYTQRAGEILYVPAGWVHQTINIGESIAFGAQTVQSAEEKGRLADMALAHDPRNAEALKQKALSASHLAMQEDSRSKFSISGATLNGMVRISADPAAAEAGSRGNEGGGHNNPGTSTDFDKLVLQSEDTWLLLVLPMAPTAEGKEKVVEYSKLWNEVAGQLKGILSVGVVEGGALPDDTVEREDVVVLLSFGDRPEGMSARDAVETAALYDPRAGMTMELVTAFALQRMAERPGAKEGSVTTVGAKARRIYADAEKHVRALLEVFPLSPEGHSLLCEVLGHGGKRGEQVPAVERALALYTRLGQSKSLSPAAIAALYGQLAECYLGTEQPGKALPLLQRSLDTHPHYFEAYVDMIAAYSMVNDEEGVKNTLDKAEKAGLKRNHPEIRQVLARQGKNTGKGSPRRGGAKPPPGRRQMKQAPLSVKDDL